MSAIIETDHYVKIRRVMREIQGCPFWKAFDILYTEFDLWFAITLKQSQLPPNFFSHFSFQECGEALLKGFDSIYNDRLKRGLVETMVETAIGQQWDIFLESFQKQPFRRHGLSRLRDLTAFLPATPRAEWARQAIEKCIILVPIT